MPDNTPQGQGKGLDPTFDPKAQGQGGANSAGHGQSAFGHGRGRADEEDKGDRHESAPGQMGGGLGAGRADDDAGDDGQAAA